MENHYKLSQTIETIKQLNIETDKQYGFREKHSTCMALLDIIDHITEELDSKKYSLGIFIDLSITFDTINHNTLIEKIAFIWSRVNIWASSVHHLH